MPSKVSPAHAGMYLDSSAKPRAWFCPVREHWIEAVVCGKLQDRGRTRCEKYECPHLDENAACHQWADYQKGTEGGSPCGG